MLAFLKRKHKRFVIIEIIVSIKRNSFVALEVRVLQIHVLQVRVLQVHVLQVRVLQVRGLQILVLQILVLQIRVLQVRVLQIQSSPVLEIQYARQSDIRTPLGRPVCVMYMYVTLGQISYNINHFTLIKLQMLRLVKNE